MKPEISFIKMCCLVLYLKECDSQSVPGSGSEPAAGSPQTFWMTAVTRPRDRADGQSGQRTFILIPLEKTIAILNELQHWKTTGTQKTKTHCYFFMKTELGIELLI